MILGEKLFNISRTMKDAHNPYVITQDFIEQKHIGVMREGPHSQIDEP